MAKKKKAVVSNPARGFATTSLPKKSAKSEEELSSAANTPPLQESAARQSANSGGPSVASSESAHLADGRTASDHVPSAEELEYELEKQDLQNFVDRHAAKIQREAARSASKLQTDIRVLRSQSQTLSTRSMLPQPLGLRILELAKAEVEDGRFAATADRASRPLPEEDAVARIWILQKVLRELNFSNETVTRALKFVLRYPPPYDHSSTLPWGLEHCLDWLVLNLDEDEIPIYNANTGRARLNGPQEDDAEIDDKLHADSDSMPAPKILSDGAQASSAAESAPGESIDGAQQQETEVSDLDSDMDPEEMIQAYLATKARLYEISPSLIDRATSKSKKSGGSTPPQKLSNRRDVSKLKRRINLIESDSLFDKSQADQKWIQKRNAFAQEAAERRKLNLTGSEKETKVPSRNDQREESGEENINADSAEEALEAASDDDNALGNLFSAVAGSDANAPPTNENADGPGANVTIRDFGNPKGVNPRRILEESCRARDPNVRLEFKTISSVAFSSRHSLRITWSTRPSSTFTLQIPPVSSVSTQKVWSFAMVGVSTPDAKQSESFISTFALFQLLSTLAKDDKAYLRLPTSYRHLYTEFSDDFKRQSDEADRETVRSLKSLVREELEGDSEDVVLTRNFKTRNYDSSGKNSSRHSEQGDGDLIVPHQQLQELWLAKTSSPSYQRMLEPRNKLPILKHQDEILSTIDSNQVTIVCGDTGCGKSTQVPHFLLGKSLSRGEPCKIYCTEPRRISAITLAQRVGEELGEKRNELGTSRSLVGYSIRLESRHSASTRLVYATTGIVLRMLESPENFEKEVTHIVIDEVHERSIETDFLLIILRSLLKRRPSLKVVLMSATVDSQRFSTYFNGAPVLNVPGRTFPVQTKFLEDAIDLTGFVLDDDGREVYSEAEEHSEDNSTKGSAESGQGPDLQRYSAKTRSMLSKYNEYRIEYNLIFQLISKIASDAAYAQYSKAILVFLPGFAEIRRLNDILGASPLSQDFVIHALHSSIASDDQQRAFELPPKGLGKIVLATNIAETGITIPDITCVIDTGTHKEMRFDERRQISRLLESFISRANAKQRRGRAGRVQEGLCFHLFTKTRHDRLMNDQSTPEMLRLSLQDLVMRVKITKLGDIQSALAEALDPPSSKNVQRAISSLIEVGALTPTEELTPLGQQLAKLPLDQYLGKLVLYGAVFGCLDVALTVAAILTSKSPFVSVVGAQKSAQTAREAFRKGDSDLLTEHNAYESWRRACQNPAASGFLFCKKNFLSPQTLSSIEDLKSQLLLCLADVGIVPLNSAARQALGRVQNSGNRNQRFVTIPDELNEANDNTELSRAVIGWSFFPKILCRDGKGWRNISTSQAISIHPTSVLRSANIPQVQYLSYYSILQSTGSKNYNANSLTPAHGLALVLLAGEASFHPTAQVVSIDGARLRFSAVDGWKAFVALKFLRRRLEEIVERRWKAPDRPVDSRLREWWSIWLEVVRSWAGRSESTGK